MGGFQLRRGVGFPAETPLKVSISRQTRGQDSDGNDPVGNGIMAAPHLAHAASAQQLDQPVPTEWQLRRTSRLLAFAEFFDHLNNMHRVPRCRYSTALLNFQAEPSGDDSPGPPEGR